MANINRQQFSKYLAGTSLPSAAVLRKICSALNVSEKSLFLEPQPQDGQVKTDVSILTLEKLVKDFGGAASLINFNDVDFPIRQLFLLFFADPCAWEWSFAHLFKLRKLIGV